MMKYTISKGMALVVLIGSSCTNHPPVPTRKPMPIQVKEVRQQHVFNYIEAVGIVDSSQTVEVRPQVKGKLLRVHFEDGQKVQKGDLLYTIDSQEYLAQKDKARADLLKDKAQADFSKRTVERYVGLMEEEFISHQSFDEFQNNALTSQAQMEADLADHALAEIQLGYCQIYAPIGGRTGENLIDEGNILKEEQDDPLTVIRCFSPAQVQFHVPQKDFEKIWEAQKEGKLECEIHLPENQNEQPDLATLYFVDNQIDPQTGTILLKAQWSNEEEKFWPGAFVRVKVRLGASTSGLVIPKNALQYSSQGEFVYVLQSDMTVAAQPVNVMQSHGEDWVVKGQITTQDKIVIEGQLNLYPGCSVLIHSDSDSQEQAKS